MAEKIKTENSSKFALGGFVRQFNSPEPWFTMLEEAVEKEHTVDYLFIAYQDSYDINTVNKLSEKVNLILINTAGDPALIDGLKSIGVDQEIIDDLCVFPENKNQITEAIALNQIILYALLRGVGYILTITDGFNFYSGIDFIGIMKKPLEQADVIASTAIPYRPDIEKILQVLGPQQLIDTFFLRDYSGSMAGKSTELVVTQHVLIYSWLLYQYAMQVETRFILHDTEASEVKDFYTYYNSAVAGGTQVSSAYRLVNEIVEKENLARDYNIYIFHGTDGDDWDTDGKESLPQLEKMLSYASRIGVSIAEHTQDTTHNTEVEKYLKKSGVLTEKPDLIRLDVMNQGADEPRLIEGIKKLISE